MIRVLYVTGMLLLLLLPAFAQEETDAEGMQDHPLLSRMPGFYISGGEVKDFDSYESPYISGTDQVWEGKLTKINYSAKTGSKSVSMVQIARNYENAAKKLGARVLVSDPGLFQGKITQNGATTYVGAQAFNDGRDYELIIVECKPMEDEITVDANALHESISTTGKAAVYGIFFDTGKSDIKPESEPALSQIALLLKQHPKLRLYVVGHTDYTGDLDANLKLSADRAAAVVRDLVKRGTDSARLRPAGVGPYAPESTNTTEAGRAKNRRVELVEQQ